MSHLLGFKVQIYPPIIVVFKYHLVVTVKRKGLLNATMTTGSTPEQENTTEPHFALYYEDPFLEQPFCY
jgi:hypothetical protein